jgi:hypothetical protein
MRAALVLEVRFEQPAPKEQLTFRAFRIIQRVRGDVKDRPLEQSAPYHGTAKCYSCSAVEASASFSMYFGCLGVACAVRRARQFMALTDSLDFSRPTQTPSSCPSTPRRCPLFLAMPAEVDRWLRKLIQQGQRPIGVGLWFSPGYSFVIAAMSVAVAFAASAMTGRFASMKAVGGIISTSASALFLFRDRYRQHVGALCSDLIDPT